MLFCNRYAGRRSFGSEGVAEPEPRAGADDLEDVALANLTKVTKVVTETRAANHPAVQ